MRLYMVWRFSCHTCVQRRRCQTPRACGKCIPLASTQSFATPWINSVPVHTQHYQDTHQSVSGAVHQMSSSTCNKTQDEACSGWPQFGSKAEAEHLVLRIHSMCWAWFGADWVWLVGGRGHGHHRDLTSRCSILHWGWLSYFYCTANISAYFPDLLYSVRFAWNMSTDP